MARSFEVESCMMVANRPEADINDSAVSRPLRSPQYPSEAELGPTRSLLIEQVLDSPGKGASQTAYPIVVLRLRKRRHAHESLAADHQAVALHRNPIRVATLEWRQCGVEHPDCFVDLHILGDITLMILAPLPEEGRVRIADADRDPIAPSEQETLQDREVSVAFQLDYAPPRSGWKLITVTGLPKFTLEADPGHTRERWRVCHASPAAPELRLEEVQNWILARQRIRSGFESPLAGGIKLSLQRFELGEELDSCECGSAVIELDRAEVALAEIKHLDRCCNDALLHFHPEILAAGN